MAYKFTLIVLLVNLKGLPKLLYGSTLPILPYDFKFPYLSALYALHGSGTY